MSWDGIDRRNKTRKDNVNYDSFTERDLLVSVHSGLLNHISNFYEHKKDDDSRFSSITKDLKFLTAGYYVFIGAVIIIEFIIRR